MYYVRTDMHVRMKLSIYIAPYRILLGSNLEIVLIGIIPELKDSLAIHNLHIKVKGVREENKRLPNIP